MSIHLFRIITLILTFIALCFALPWARTNAIRILLSVGISCIAYSGYCLSGASGQLGAYYSAEAVAERAKHPKIRVLLSALRKKEFRLHVRLEENPNDIEAKWSLLNLMGIHAYESQQYKLAIAYWQQALVLIPKTSEQIPIRTMIERLVVNAQKK
jgi:cytochrome c-type biogenesis protein CcmH/NrfG